MNGNATLKLDYLEAVRLYLWYQGSPFSFHQSKANAKLASQYKNLAQKLYQQFLDSRKPERES